MRKLVVSTYVTLDGVMEDPAWSAPYWSDQAQQFARDQLWASDALLLGRKTYELFAASWPTKEWVEREGELAERMNRYPKYVASTRLEEPLEWSNSSLLEGDIAEAVAKLRREPGRNILIYSSVDLMHTLMQHDLIDAYHIWVHPLVLGSGRRLFKDGVDKAELKLVDTTTLPNGVVVLDYHPAG